MIVDSSAIVAIVLNEPGWEGLDAAIDAAIAPKMSAATYVETGIVIDSRRRATASRRLDQLLAAWKVDIVDVTAEQAVVARGAYRDYGKGSGHPAQLNYGDTFSYALAASTGEPLLFVGDNFTHTDLVVAATS